MTTFPIADTTRMSEANAARYRGQADRSASPFAPASSLLAELGYATAATALAVLTGNAAERLLAFSDQSLIFITAVLFVSVRTRMAVAMYSATLCFLAYNFFFIHPRYSLYISAGRGVATVAVFLVAALFCGRLANRLRSQVLMLRAANARTLALQDLSQRLAIAVDEGEVSRQAVAALHAALGADTALLLLDEASGRLVPTLLQPSDLVLDPVTRTAAQACLDRAPADPHARALRLDSGWWHFRLSAGERSLGSICLRFSDLAAALPGEQQGLAQAMTQIVAQALARTRLAQQLETARVRGETERLRAALLSSVSHDLRTPLSTIIGSAESLSVYRDQLSEADRLTLARDILGEGQRLDRYIQNLLDMTRLGHGGLAIAREWVGLDEICGAVLARLRRQYPDLAVNLQLPEPPPLLWVHPGLIEQALFNLLDNAARFSPPGAPVNWSASQVDGDWQIDVGDQGPGIPAAERLLVFDMFHSAERGDRGPAGTGLGLTICQGIVAAHGGSVEALSGTGGVGTVMRVRLPAIEQPIDRSAED